MTTTAQENAPGKWSTVTTSNFGSTTAGSRSLKAIQNSWRMPFKTGAKCSPAQRADALKQAGLILAKRGV
jgi:hypothetical protein